MGVPVPIPMGITDRTIYQTFIKLARVLNSKLDRSDYQSSGLIDNEVIVKTKDDLIGTLDSSKMYLIDGIIDMESSSIVVPQGGLSVKGLGFGVSKLITTENNITLFIDDGVYSGDLFLGELEIDVSGTGAKVFDLDNDGNNGAIECVTVNFNNCTELGILDSYRQGLWDNVGIINCIDGITMHGAWSGFASVLSIIVAIGTPSFTGTLFKEGTALTLSGSFRTDMNALGLHSTGAFCDFQPSNIVEDEGMIVDGLRTNAADAFPNMSHLTVKAKFVNCRGVQNTFVGIAQTVSVLGATGALSVGVYVNNPATMAVSSDATWFQAGASGSVEYISDVEDEFSIDAILSFSGGTNDDMTAKIRQWVDATSSYTDISPIFAARLAGGAGANKIENISLSAYATMNNLDRIEIWIANQSGTTSINLLTGGQIRVTER